MRVPRRIRSQTSAVTTMLVFTSSFVCFFGATPARALTCATLFDTIDNVEYTHPKIEDLKQTATAPVIENAPTASTAAPATVKLSPTKIEFKSLIPTAALKNPVEKVTVAIEAIKTAAPQESKFLHESWSIEAEASYQEMLASNGVTKTEAPLPFEADKLLFEAWNQNPSLFEPLSKVGFRRTDTTVEYPATFKSLVTELESAGSASGSFKIAAYGETGWYALEAAKSSEMRVDADKDMSFSAYAKMMAKGYVPLWPAPKSLNLMHDLSHVTEYLEYPNVFPALQKFFSNFENQGWAKFEYYQMRARAFNEMSYILKTDRYVDVDGLMVSTGFRFGSLTIHAAKIRSALAKDQIGTIAKITRLTDAFDGLYERHGGAARDFHSADSTMLSKETVAAYVNGMLSNPSKGSYEHAIGKEARIEALESLEGIHRQILYVAELLTKSPTEELRAYLAYRVAQVEISMLAQRKLKLTQEQIIEDSMLPLGASSKTRTYFKSFQPAGSMHYSAFVDR